MNLFKLQFSKSSAATGSYTSIVVSAVLPNTVAKFMSVVASSDYFPSIKIEIT